jgi:hypothetical protein
VLLSQVGSSSSVMGWCDGLFSRAGAVPASCENEASTTCTSVESTRHKCCPDTNAVPDKQGGKGRRRGVLGTSTRLPGGSSFHAVILQTRQGCVGMHAGEARELHVPPVLSWEGAPNLTGSASALGPKSLGGRLRGVGVGGGADYRFEVKVRCLRVRVRVRVRALSMSAHLTVI